MANQPITFDRQRELISRLTSLAAQRTAKGAETAVRDRERIAAARQHIDQLRAQANAEFEKHHAALIAEYKATRESLFKQYEAEGCRLAQDQLQFESRSAQELIDSIADAKTLRQHRIQQTLKAFRTQRVGPRKELAIFKQRWQAAEHDANSLVAKAQALVRGRCPWPDTPAHPTVPPGLTRKQYMEGFLRALGRAAELLAKLQNQPSARFLEEGWLILIFFATLILAAYPSWLLLGGIHIIAPIVGIVAVAVAVTFGLRQAVLPFVRKQTQQIVPEFQNAIAEAHGHLSASLAAANSACEQARRQLREKLNADIAAAKTEYKRYRKDQKARVKTQTQKMALEYAARRKALEDKFEPRIDDVDRKYPLQIKQLEDQFTRQAENLRQELAQRRAESQGDRERELGELSTAWSSALTEFQQSAEAMNAACDQRFPAWSSIDWKSWSPGGTAQADSDGNGKPAELVRALKFGHFTVPVPAVEDAGSQTAHELPAVLSYPERPSLLLQVEGEGREVSTRLLQNVMLRLLTTFPPGKVRFTIIDPVGLGQNFSAFMHLADYDDKLVNSRIWTEANHIAQKLADLTEHMENVIQKYLRNEFASIQEYNQHAGEVSEPFQILVVANFPANFSDESARRLASIASSGPRCGVYTLISTDTRLALPRNFDLADLEAQSMTLVWNSDQQRFHWKGADVQQLPVTLEELPGDEQFTHIVRTVGQLAKEAARVEVPFEMVTPAPHEWWTGDSREVVQVPLGRAGAKNLQYMRLGKGTSQHVLISGKTGSGKSTLLNAMITNLATHYSPTELEFYLIDFKKGVEFKAYAACKLPHARVIAIESEREFGMSVLERLDQVLKDRGDLFRKAGVQDVKGYRHVEPTATMPRVLLIIDEFQEFFTSDDRISHDAVLLLDRLVRQGRAFGIHVLLGSQTLAGAYTLARSTLGQMAVRIALQCSEADAHLILSEDNTAARLLNRPGEAIYNDANGLFEGNHPFQVVWLSDGEREEYLRRIGEMAIEKRVVTPPPIVFEGNAAANPHENQLLRQAVESGQKVAAGGALSAWLGAAVAIKDPTAAVFRPQTGSNLLVVGQNEELALGAMSVGFVSLAAQMAEREEKGLSRFHVLDGTRPDAPDAGFWQRLVKATGIDADIVLPIQAGNVVGQLAAEVERRVAAQEQAAEPVFLFVHNLARFRELKKGDDYSFDEDGGGANAGKKLATILREGPTVGVHTLIWCDSHNNLSRWLDRQALRDFEMRVLFQMSANDSANLMDSPSASKLGNHTAIFYSDERGLSEKFRPYGVPSPDWLRSVAQAFTGCQRASTG